MRLPRVPQFQFFLSPASLLVLLGAQRPNPAELDDPLLRLIHTRHYIFHTDLDESLADDLSTRMDSMYDQYVKTFSDFRPRADAPPLPVYLFKTHEKYMAFTDYSGTNTGGLFVAGRRPYLTAYEQGQGRDALRRTLQHEAFHQFAHASISRQLPPWMNEGMAQLFEETIWTGTDFITEQIPPRRVRQLKVDITQKRLVEFDQFLALSPHDWTAMLHSNLEKAATAYNQAWAMAYFCSNAGDPAYHQRFMDLLKSLHEENSSVTEATHKAFPDLKEFRKKFNIWAARLKATPEASQLENQDTLGDFLLAVTQHDRPAPVDLTALRDLVVEQNLKISYTRNNFTFTTADRPIVYFSDSTGTLYRPEELYFKRDADAPQPDIICQPVGSKYSYRTHFYLSAGKTEHETLIALIKS